MADQPGFWSEEKFPYMPLLALGQAIPRGYQYQSQMTPYRRSARGDWGRAVNESIDQFFNIYPQWQQQKRANALQREQIARQRLEDQHRAKLRPFELRQLETNEKLLQQKLQMQKNYPALVDSLPIPDTYKTYLKGRPASEGTSIIQGHLSSMMKHQRERLRPVDPRDPRLADYPAAMQKHLMYNKDNQIVEDPGLSTDLQKQMIEQGRPTPTNLFQQKHSETNYENISSYADLGPFAGSRIESQKNFALTNLPPTHSLYKMAQADYNRRFVEIGPNGVLVSEGFRGEYNAPGKKGFTSGKPESVRVNKGDTLSGIIQKFDARGIKVQPSQVIAANKHFFTDERGIPNPDKMLTSDQLGGSEMIIPTGGPAMNDAQIGEAHKTDSFGHARHRTVVMPGIGTIHTMKNTTLPQEIELNRELGGMRKMQSNVQEMLELLYDKESRNWFKLGTKERGKVEAIRWRLVNNIQVMRDFGVLTPGEIEVIEQSLPDMNSFINLLASDFRSDKFGQVNHRGKMVTEGGSERFIEGALKALESEAVTKQNELRGIMKAYGVPEIGFDIDIYNPKEDSFRSQSGAGVNKSSSENFVDSLR